MTTSARLQDMGVDDSLSSLKEACRTLENVDGSNNTCVLPHNVILLKDEITLDYESGLELNKKSFHFTFGLK